MVTLPCGRPLYLSDVHLNSVLSDIVVFTLCAVLHCLVYLFNPSMLFVSDEPYCGLDAVSLPNFHIEALMPEVVVFGGGACGR